MKPVATNSEPARPVANALREWQAPVLQVMDAKSLTRGNNNTTADNNIGAPQLQNNANPSDTRLKRDVVRLGKTPSGLQLYRFRYLWSNTEMVGVMAQELLERFPSAVIQGEDGYFSVDYSQIDAVCVPYAQYLQMDDAARLRSSPYRNGIHAV